MTIESGQALLRVHLRNTDKCGWSSAAATLVERARERGLAGATLFRGVLGLDVTGELLEPSAWAVVERLPVVVECADDPDVIIPFLSVVKETVPEFVMTLARGYARLSRGRASAHPSDESSVPGGFGFPPGLAWSRLGDDGERLRVFVADSDAYEGLPLYRALVGRARELALDCAAVFRGGMGYGANNRLHQDTFWRRALDLPVVVEVIGRRRGIEALLPFLDAAVGEGTAAVEDVRILRP
jgi:PII-like signaling protein